MALPLTGIGPPAFFLWHKPLSKSVTPELIKLGANTITSFGENRKEAQLMTARYPACRDMLLRNHVWAFAKKFQSLAALTGTVDIEKWEYRHQLPSDCARILSVTINDYPIDFERVGPVIYTEESPPDLRYVRHFSNGTEDAFAFPDDFAEALAFYLAGDVAVSLTQSDAYSQKNFSLYNDTVRQARFNGAVELATPDSTNDWIDQHSGMGSLIDPPYRGLTGY